MPRKNSQRQRSELASRELRLLYPPLPGHPVQTALREAAWQRFEEAADLVETMRQLKPTRDKGAKIEPMSANCAELISECVELLHWFIGDVKPQTPEQADGVAKMMLEVGFPASQALELAKAIQRRPRKRPADKRSLAIDALELQRANAGRRTWRELAKQTYGCRHPEKDRCKCGEHLRQEVIHVKRFLAKMHVPLPDTPRK